MERYESYKPSRTEWLGNVPAHWDVQPLRAVTVLKSDKNRPDLPVLSVYREYGVILKDSRDDNHNATSLDTSTYKVVKPGDLVVNKMKAWQGSMGVSTHTGIVSPAYITCTTRSDRARPAYLHYLLRSSPLISVYNSLSYGVRVGQWDMHYEDFKQLLIPLPPQEEQDRIVAFLDQKTAEIDAAVAKKERLIELLEEQKQGLIDQAVTVGKNLSVAIQKTEIPGFSEISSVWSMRKIKHVCRYQEGPGIMAADFKESGIPLIRIAGVKGDQVSLEGCNFLSELKVKRRWNHFRLNRGDLLISGSASSGTVSEVTSVAEGAVAYTGLFRITLDQV